MLAAIYDRLGSADVLQVIEGVRDARWGVPGAGLKLP